MSPKPAAVRRRLNPDERREQLIIAAAQLFGERAYADVFLADVAAKAGVAPGLIHHYFGGKRELFLDVVRYLVVVPPLDQIHLPDGTLTERVEASVDWMLTVIETHSVAWLTVAGLPGGADDPELAKILDDADEQAAQRALDAVGFDDASVAPVAIAAVRSFGGMIKEGSRQWLVHGRLTRGQLRTLLAGTLSNVLENLVPEMGAESR